MSKKKIPDDWQQLLAEFERRADEARAMGGGEKLRRRADRGKRNARDRKSVV